MDQNVGRLYYRLTNIRVIPSEVWLPVKGWEGFYSVSNLGRVQSLTRLKHHYRGGKSLVHGLVLSQILRKDYLYVNLCVDGRRETRPVHQLVGEVFVENPEEFLILNHEDGSPINNKSSNLKWGTQSYNALHAYELGLNMKKHGQANHQAKLTNEEVKKIRYFLRVSGYRYADIGKIFGVSAATISNIKNKKNWAKI